MTTVSVADAVAALILLQSTDIALSTVLYSQPYLTAKTLNPVWTFTASPALSSIVTAAWQFLASSNTSTSTSTGLLTLLVAASSNSRASVSGVTLPAAALSKGVTLLAVGTELLTWIWPSISTLPLLLPAPGISYPATLDVATVKATNVSLRVVNSVAKPSLVRVAADTAALLFPISELNATAKQRGLVRNTTLWWGRILYATRLTGVTALPHCVPRNGSYACVDGLRPLNATRADDGYVLLVPVFNGGGVVTTTALAVINTVTLQLDLSSDAPFLLIDSRGSFLSNTSAASSSTTGDTAISIYLAEGVWSTVAVYATMLFGVTPFQYVIDGASPSGPGRIVILASGTTVATPTVNISAGLASVGLVSKNATSTATAAPRLAVIVPLWNNTLLVSSVAATSTTRYGTFLAAATGFNCPSSLSTSDRCVACVASSSASLSGGNSSSSSSGSSGNNSSAGSTDGSDLVIAASDARVWTPTGVTQRYGVVTVGGSLLVGQTAACVATTYAIDTIVVVSGGSLKVVSNLQCRITILLGGSTGSASVPGRIFVDDTTIVRRGLIYAAPLSSVVMSGEATVPWAWAPLDATAAFTVPSDAVLPANQTSSFGAVPVYIAGVNAFDAGVKLSMYSSGHGAISSASDGSLYDALLRAGSDFPNFMYDDRHLQPPALAFIVPTARSLVVTGAALGQVQAPCGMRFDSASRVEVIGVALINCSGTNIDATTDAAIRISGSNASALPALSGVVVITSSSEAAGIAVTHPATTLQRVVVIQTAGDATGNGIDLQADSATIVGSLIATASSVGNVTQLPSCGVLAAGDRATLRSTVVVGAFGTGFCLPRAAATACPAFSVDTTFPTTAAGAQRGVAFDSTPAPATGASTTQLCGSARLIAVYGSSIVGLQCPVYTAATCVLDRVTLHDNRIAVSTAVRNDSNITNSLVMGWSGPSRLLSCRDESLSDALDMTALVLLMPRSGNYSVGLSAGIVTLTNVLLKQGTADCTGAIVSAFAMSNPDLPLPRIVLSGNMTVRSADGQSDYSWLWIAPKVVSQAGDCGTNAALKGSLNCLAWNHFNVIDSAGIDTGSPPPTAIVTLPNAVPLVGCRVLSVLGATSSLKECPSTTALWGSISITSFGTNAASRPGALWLSAPSYAAPYSVAMFQYVFTNASSAPLPTGTLIVPTTGAYATWPMTISDVELKGLQQVARMRIGLVDCINVTSATSSLFLTISPPTRFTHIWNLTSRTPLSTTLDPLSAASSPYLYVMDVDAGKLQLQLRCGATMLDVHFLPTANFTLRMQVFVDFFQPRSVVEKLVASALGVEQSRVWLAAVERDPGSYTGAALVTFAVAVDDSFNYNVSAAATTLNTLVTSVVGTESGIVAFGRAIGLPPPNTPLLISLYLAVTGVDTNAALSNTKAFGVSAADFAPVFAFAPQIFLAVGLVVATRVYSWRRRSQPGEKPIVPGDLLPNCKPATIRSTDPRTAFYVRDHTLYDQLSIGAKSALQLEESSGGSTSFALSTQPLLAALKEAVLGTSQLFSGSGDLAMGENWATSPIRRGPASRGGTSSSSPMHSQSKSNSAEASAMLGSDTAVIPARPTYHFVRTHEAAPKPKRKI